jgi:hypothetical protein
MIDTVLNALVDILEKKLIDDVPVGDTARPSTIKIGSLQDDPTRITPSILVKHHPDLGSVPGWVPGHKMETLEEIGGGQLWTHNFLISVKVYTNTKDSMISIRQILMGRILKALRENYTLESTMDPETDETISSGESHVIAGVKSKISGGDTDWFGDLEITVHYHTRVGDYDDC